ncbi:hypothetical protein HanXRQr2_Chr16g0754751 [Helianthus annuus]|uniref:Uncharacterized protein n=1 Tax=Helianthus annuus TaxID=4232 RepID=A0A9K3DRV2_HELAN|nr:hypothetical protein HanXRQr2_Chr16g0754751 [Helianthus annuus]KAJ0821708.1 hypothetical protein HanPSC8_Chr16g0723411 [Helianthus annuus]
MNLLYMALKRCVQLISNKYPVPTINVYIVLIVFSLDLNDNYGCNCCGDGSVN